MCIAPTYSVDPALFEHTVSGLMALPGYVSDVPASRRDPLVSDAARAHRQGILDGVKALQGPPVDLMDLFLRHVAATLQTLPLV